MPCTPCPFLLFMRLHRRRARRAPARPHVALPRVVGRSRACSAGVVLGVDARARVVFCSSSACGGSRSRCSRCSRSPIARSRCSCATCSCRSAACSTAFWARATSAPASDSDAYALCVRGVGARARADARAARRGSPRAATTRAPLGDAEVVVTALLASARGDAETARQLLRSTLDLVEVHPARARARRRVARVRRRRARRVGRARTPTRTAARWPATPLTYFLEGVAARRVGAARRAERGASCTRAGCSRRIAARRARCSRTPCRAPPAPTSGATATATRRTRARRPSARRCRARSPRTSRSRARRTPSRRLRATRSRAWDAALADGATPRVARAPRARARRAARRRRARAARRRARGHRRARARSPTRAQLGAPAARGPVGDALARRLRHGRLDALEAGFTRWDDAPRTAATSARRSTSGASWSRCAPRTTPRSPPAASSCAASRSRTRTRRARAWPRGCGTRATSTRCRTRSSTWLLDEALAVGDTEAIEHAARATRGSPCRRAPADVESVRQDASDFAQSQPSSSCVMWQRRHIRRLPRSSARHRALPRQPARCGDACTRAGLGAVAGQAVLLAVARRARC